MAEKVIIYQDKSFRTVFRAADPNAEEQEDPENITQLHALTPYGMLLASLGSCTAIVLNSYARNHNIPLRGVTVECTYDRAFVEDCDDCDPENEYEEIIRESLSFEGDLDPSQQKRLHQIAKACSVRRMLEGGIRVESA
jgi:putative redox protein